MSLCDNNLINIIRVNRSTQHNKVYMNVSRSVFAIDFLEKYHKILRLALTNFLKYFIAFEIKIII